MSNAKMTLLISALLVAIRPIVNMAGEVLL